MAGEMVTVGTTVVVSFQSRELGGLWTLLTDESTETSSSEVKEIRNSSNAVCTKLISNPGRGYTLTGIMLTADLARAEALKIGDDIVIDGLTMMVADVQISLGREEGKVTIRATHEDSIVYESV